MQSKAQRSSQAGASNQRAIVVVSMPRVRCALLLLCSLDVTSGFVLFGPGARQRKVAASAIKCQEEAPAPAVSRSIDDYGAGGAGGRWPERQRVSQQADRGDYSGGGGYQREGSYGRRCRIPCGCRPPPGW